MLNHRVTKSTKFHQERQKLVLVLLVFLCVLGDLVVDVPPFNQS